MHDPGSSLNIISFSSPKRSGYTQNRITRRCIEVSGVGGNCICTMGFVNLNLTVGSLAAVHRFHVIDF